MDGSRFDHMIRTLSASSSRRGVLGSLTAALGLAATRRPDAAKTKKRRKKPLRFNEFGCINVGRLCRGRDALCCSGICEGRRPRKGKKDRRRCVAHDVGSCQAGMREAFCGGTTDTPCTTDTGSGGTCDTTTGNAGYCTGGFLCGAGCTRDADCQSFFTNQQAACIRCAGCPPSGTGCAIP